MPSYESPGSPSSRPLSSSSRRHLETQLAELQRRYETLTKRIAALDTDVSREVDSERKLALQERRAELAAERNQITAEMERLELQLYAPTDASAALPVAADTTVSAVSLSSPDRASLERQLADLRDNLRLIEERKSEYVQETDIPLQLIKNERHLRERLAELTARLGPS